MGLAEDWDPSKSYIFGKQAELGKASMFPHNGFVVFAGSPFEESLRLETTLNSDITRRYGSIYVAMFNSKFCHSLTTYLGSIGEAKTLCA